MMSHRTFYQPEVLLRLVISESSGGMKSIFLKAELCILFLISSVPPSAAYSRVLLSLDPAASPACQAAV